MPSGNSQGSAFTRVGRGYKGPWNPWSLRHVYLFLESIDSSCLENSPVIKRKVKPQDTTKIRVLANSVNSSVESCTWNKSLQLFTSRKPIIFLQIKSFYSKRMLPKRIYKIWTRKLSTSVKRIIWWNNLWTVYQEAFASVSLIFSVLFYYWFFFLMVFSKAVGIGSFRPSISGAGYWNNSFWSSWQYEAKTTSQKVKIWIN